MKRFLLCAALAAVPAAAQTNRIPQVSGSVAKLVPPSPVPNGFIADVPNIIPADAKEAANAHIQSLQAGGFGDIGVAILPTIGDYRPYEVGLAIYRSWKIGSQAQIGSAHRDVGLLLLIVIKELSPNKKGECWITTGTGAEGIVTDATAAAICRDKIVPFLKDKNYGAAVIAGVTAMGEKLRGDAGLAGDSASATSTGEPVPLIQDSSTDRKGGIRWWHVLGAGFLGLGGLRGAFWVRRNRPRRCRKCQSKMVRLDEQADDQALDRGQQMEEHLKSVDYDVWHCTNCEETLVLPYKSLFSKYGKCKECRRRTALTKRTVLSQPTYSSSGLARDDTTCKFCGAHYTKQVVLPKLTRSSSSSGGSSGGGSSFGGSGSSSGGGGGSSY